MPAHHPADHIRPQAPELETKWRRIATSIQSRARAAATTPASVNIVGLEEESGWATMEEYRNTIIAEYELQRSQGNGEGPSV